jgi:release factor glutamine methyltransferase
VSEGAAPTVAAALAEATRRLRVAGVPDPGYEASTLLAKALGTDRGGVAARKPDAITPEHAARFDEMLASRVVREPLQQILGLAEFRGLEFEVNPDVLIPRPETEDLVQAVLDAGLAADARVLDLGTGSGCIAVTLAASRPAWQVVAVDLSAAALRVAARNAAKHGVADRVRPAERDFATVPPEERGQYHAVVSNPPYVPEDEWRGLQPEVRDHEPRIALVPGPTGNEAYEAIILAAWALLRPGGLLALELGWKSEAAVRAMAASAGYSEVAVRADLQGIPRILTART